MNRTSRLSRYVAIMFPPAHVAQALAFFASIHFSLQALAGATTLRFGWKGAVGAASVLLAFLIVRLYDDVRDAPSDLRLASAGDPRYVGRPTVTGLVSIAEVRGLSAALSLVLAAINLAWSGPRAVIVSMAGFGITWLAFHWFYLPSLAGQSNPLPTLARKSLTVLMAGYVIAVFCDERMAAPVTAWVWPLAIAPCFEAAAWEVSRKIRAAGQETEYATYSKLFGARRAAILVALFAALSLMCLLPVGLRSGLVGAYPLALALATLVLIVACARFIHRPIASRANLRPYAELFGAVANGGLAIALCLRYGIEIR